MTRDMSKKQFEAALQRHGIRRTGFLGYVELGIPNHSISISPYNAGTNKRAQLAYILKTKAAYEKEYEK